MKKNCTGNIVLVGFFISASGFVACNNKPAEDAHTAHNPSSKELTIDSSIASLAKPVNTQVVATIPVIAPESGVRIFSTEIKGQVTYDTRDQTSISSRVSGRIEKLYIKYNYQPVKRGQLIMEIYSPDLAAAQRELLFIAQSGNDENMLSKAKQRLSLLGMQATQINQVLKTGKVLYRVPVYGTANGYILEKQTAVTPSNVTASPTPAAETGGMDNMSSESGINSPGSAATSISSVPLFIREGQYINAGQSLFTIYRAENLVAEFALRPEMAAQIKRGQTLNFRTTIAEAKVHTGSIGLIQPVVRNGENFTSARVYIADKDLLPGQLITANIPVVYKTGWWLPKKSIWQSGNTAIVFKKQGDVFVPTQVETGVEAEGMVMVITSIGDWMVAENAWYLVDSESFIKTTNQTVK